MVRMAQDKTPMRRALVVDDEEALAKLVAGYLERDGFEVHTAFDGPAGVEAARAVDPDVVVLDLGLPQLDGIEVCRQLRTFSDCYVVMLTARSEEIDTLIGLSVGADDYMTKPFSPRELLARIGVLMRRPRRTSGVLVQQVHQDLGQAVRIPDHLCGCVTRSGGTEGDVRIDELGPEPFGGSNSQSSEIHAAHPQLEATLLGLRERAQVLREPAQPGELRTELAERLPVRREDSGDHSLDIALEHRQWGPHLMRHLAEKLLPARLRLGQASGEGVDVGDEVRKLGVGWYGDRPVVVALSEATRRRTDLDQGHQDAAR